MHHDDCREAVLKDEITPPVRDHLQRCRTCAQLADAVAALKADLRDPPPASCDLVERVVERHVREEAAADSRRASAWERIPVLLARARGRGERRRSGRALVTVLTSTVAIATVLVSALVLGLTSRGAVAMTAFTAACPEKTDRLVVAGAWEGEEQTRFAEVLERFTESTGAKVRYESKQRDIAGELRSDFATPLTKRVAADCPPDVALLPQPALLEDFARRGHLEPLDRSTRALVTRNYRRQWRQLATVDDKLYGVWLKAANKSTIWYSRRLFDKAGIRPPRTLDELEDVAGRLDAAGVTPFAVAGDDGWTLTDWFENVYLQTAGPDRYDRLASGELSWTDPSVRAALLRLSTILGRGKWSDEQVGRAMKTDFEDSVAQVARGEAAMVFEGDFVDSFIDERSQRDIGAFPFPTGPAGSGGAVVGGDVAVQFTDNPAARKLMRFLATPEAAEPWARAGGFISPNRKLDPDAYGDRVTRRLATALSDAKDVRFDLSDLQPPGFGAMPTQGMRPLFQRYLKEGPSSIDEVTRDLQAGGQSARRCEEANAVDVPAHC